MTPEELQSIIGVGEMKADMTHIKEGMARIERIMESGFSRGGERFGAIETKVNGLELTVVKHEEADKAVAESVKDLKEGRKWFITSIGGIMLAQLWDFIRGK